MGGGEDLGAQMFRQLDRRLADAACGRVDQHLVTGTHLGEPDQAVVGGQEGYREAGGLGEGPVGGQFARRALVGDQQRAEGAFAHYQNTIAGPQVGDARADFGDDTCGFRP